MKRSLWEKEWNYLLKKEEKYVQKHSQPNTERFLSRLEHLVPDGLQSKLDKAFTKAFQLIFEKGTFIIEKTYNKQKRREDYDISEYAAQVREDRKHVRAFRRRASHCVHINLLISAVEGIVLGLLGIGIPDIPLFVSMTLKSLYEISLSFGYEYDQPEERLFQLKLIREALYHGSDVSEMNDTINTMCQSMCGSKQREPEETVRLGVQLDHEIELTAKALSDETLYAKFLQGMAIVGIVGGMTDVTVLKRITDYAMLKYCRRYLLDRDLSDMGKSES